MNLDDTKNSVEVTGSYAGNDFLITGAIDAKTISGLFK